MFSTKVSTKNQSLNSLILSIAFSNHQRRFSNSQDFAVVSRDALVASSQALIVYSSGSGNLFYNQNGSDVGLGSGGHFAKLNNAPDLVTESFEITYR